MVDNEQITDAEIVQQVAEKDVELSKQVAARLRALRLRCIVTPAPAFAPRPGEPQAVPH